MSPDRQQSVVVIAFIGSVFSPFYYATRQKSCDVDPMDFCAFNVALYDRGKRIWGFTEWPQNRVVRESCRFGIGQNELIREKDRLTINVNESRTPGHKHINGKVVIYPQSLFSETFSLSACDKHQWYPVAPIAHIEVDFKNPTFRFSGSGYHDANTGEEPLENSFLHWSWSRHELANMTSVFYDIEPLKGKPVSWSLNFHKNGNIEEMTPPAMFDLPRTFWWRGKRSARSEAPTRPQIVHTLEDSPFYTRTIIESQLDGELSTGVHEFLSLEKFRTKWMQWMLPFRLKRDA